LGEDFTGEKNMIDRYETSPLRNIIQYRHRLIYLFYKMSRNNYLLLKYNWLKKAS